MSEKSVETREMGCVMGREEILNNPTNFSDFNKVWISGFIEEEFEISYERLWEKFYKTRVRVARLSGTEDYVPIIVSDLLLTNILGNRLKGSYVEVGGQFRSYNRKGQDGRRHLILYLYVTAISVYKNEEELEEATNANLIYLDGHICKPPVFRETPLGREITDLMVAVSRNYKKADFIPCIAWGKVAHYASELQVGDRIKLFGRVQSREYFKRFSPESEAGETRTAYEVSIMRMAKVENLRLEG